MSKTVLAFAPHPDDAEFFAGGLLANLLAEGAKVYLVIVSDGARGSFEHSSQALAEIRRQEAQRAAAVLGAEPPIFLGYPDLELDTLPPGVLRERFIRLIRQYRPEIVVAGDAFARYEVHPDHRAVAWAASDAIHFAHLPRMHPEHIEHGLEPHFVVEKYFYGEELPLANRIVDISHSIERKIAALGEHRSQVQFLVEDVLRQARLAGLDLRAVLDEALDDPLQAIAWAIRAQAAAIGQRIGVAYAEAYRYVRFHPLVENLLATQG
ncbi:MAG: PIG-L family deacetylase [Anaerolineales bacterium]|nr:PIG-L family deacetylase [Anaerolineales bacterium]MDW8446939.1 PIG-L family deacetylase [Anaerolineales bacterium]